MANFLDDIGKFFDGFGNDDSSDENDLDDLDDDDGIYTGSSRIISIPGDYLILLFSLPFMLFFVNNHCSKSIEIQYK